MTVPLIRVAIYITIKYLVQGNDLEPDLPWATRSCGHLVHETVSLSPHHRLGLPWLSLALALCLSVAHGHTGPCFGRGLSYAGETRTEEGKSMNRWQRPLSSCQRSRGRGPGAAADPAKEQVLRSHPRGSGVWSGQDRTQNLGPWQGCKQLFGWWKTPTRVKNSIQQILMAPTQCKEECSAVSLGKACPGASALFTAGPRGLRARPGAGCWGPERSWALWGPGPGSQLGPHPLAENLLSHGPLGFLPRLRDTGDGGDGGDTFGCQNIAWGQQA